MDWSGAEKQASRLAYRRLGRWFLPRPVCQPHHLPDSLCRSPTAAIVMAELTLFPFYYSQLTFYVGSSALSKYSAVRFLALAAALLSLGSPFKAATELHILFEHSSRPTQSLPRKQQSKQLFIASQSELSKAGFIDVLSEWYISATSPESEVRSLFVSPEIEPPIESGLRPSSAVDVAA